MKIIKKAVYQLTAEGMDLIEEDAFNYDGPVDEAKGSSNTIQSADPWEGVQPYLERSYYDLYGQSQQTPEFYPGQTYSDFNDLEREAQQGQVDYARSGGLQDAIRDSQTAQRNQTNLWQGPMMTGAQRNFENGRNMAETAGVAGTPAGNMAIAAGMGQGPGADMLARAGQGGGINVRDILSMVGGSIEPTTAAGARRGGGGTARPASGGLRGGGLNQSQVGGMIQQALQRFQAQGRASGGWAGSNEDNMNQAVAGGLTGANQYGNRPNTQNAMEQMLSGEINPYAREMANNAESDIYRGLREGALPGIASGAVGAGQTGSSRRGIAEGIATRGAMEEAAQQRTNIMSNAYNQARQQQTAATQLGIQRQNALDQLMSSDRQHAMNQQLTRQNTLDQIAAQRENTQTQAQASMANAAQAAGASRYGAELGQQTNFRNQNLQQLLGAGGLARDFRGQTLGNNIAQGQLGLGQNQLQAGTGVDLAQLQGQMGLGMMNNAANIYGSTNQGVNAAQGNAMNAINLGMMPNNILAGVGAANRGMDDRAIAEAQQRWDYAQNAPWDRQQQYIGTLQGQSGGTTRSTGPGANPLMGAMGAGMMGGMMGASSGIGGVSTAASFNPYTALAAAALGYMASR